MLLGINSVFAQQLAVSGGTGGSAYPAARNIGPGTNNNIISQFNLYTEEGSTLTSVTFTTQGTYQSADFKPNGFKLWRGNPYASNPLTLTEASVISTVNIVASGNNIVFSGLNQSIPPFDGSIFYVTVDVASTAVVGRTINLAAAAASNFTALSGTVIGSVTARNIQTIGEPMPAIQIYGDSPTNNNISPASTKNELYSLYIRATNNDASLSSITFTTKGTYTVSDIAANGFKLWKRDNDTDTDILLASASAVASGGNLVFDNLNTIFSEDEYENMFLTVDLSTTAVAGHTVGILSTPLSNVDFLVAESVSGPDPLQAGVLSTIAVPTLHIATIPVQAGTVSPGSINNVVYKIQLTSSNANAAVSQVKFKTQGTYQLSDIATGGFKLWSGEEYDSKTYLYEEILSVNAVASGNDIIFNFPTSGIIEQGEENWVYLTVDFSTTAVTGRTIGIPAQPTSNITITSGNVIGTSSASGLQTVQATSVAFTANGPAATKTSPATYAVLHSAKVVVTGAPATFNTATFNLSGTFVPADISEDGYMLIYHPTPNILDEVNGEGSDIIFLSSVETSPLSGQALVFPFKGQGEDYSSTIPVGTGYISVLVGIDPAATIGHTIQASSAGTSGFTFASGTKSGTTGNGGIQTIGTPSVAVSSVAVAAGNVSPGTSKHVIYKIKLDATNASAVLKGLSLTLGGSFGTSDIYSLNLYMSADNVFNEATDSYVSYEALSSGTTLTFDNLESSYQIAAGTSAYLFVLANVSPSALAGHTINVTSVTNIEFEAGTVTGSLPLAAGGIQTIAAPSSITIASTSVSAGNVNAGTTNNVIYQFHITSQGSSANLRDVALATAGTFLAGDITSYGFTLWYNTTNTFAGSSEATEANAVDNGDDIEFNYADVTIPAGATVYFFVTADISYFAGAHTIQVLAADDENFIFGSGTVSGSTSAGGIKTIIPITTGIWDKRAVSQTVVFPNPSKSSAVITINTNNSNSKMITIYNTTGSVVSTFTEENKTFYINGLQSGMYMISIHDLVEDVSDMSKIVVE